MGFAAAASAAIADLLGAVGFIAEASRRTGGKLPVLKDDAGLGEIEELGLGAALVQTELQELLEPLLRGLTERIGVHKRDEG